MGIRKLLSCTRALMLLRPFDLRPALVSALGQSKLHGLQIMSKSVFFRSGFFATAGILFFLYRSTKCNVMIKAWVTGCATDLLVASDGHLGSDYEWGKRVRKENVYPCTEVRVAAGMSGSCSVTNTTLLLWLHADSSFNGLQSSPSAPVNSGRQVR